MPTQSVLVRDSSFLARVLQQYLSLLKQYPIITKSVTSGILSALGNLLSQALEYRKHSKENSPKKKINVLGPVHFAIYGLFITGPLSHYFYQLLEVLLPTTVPYCLIKRLLLERLIFAPAFLLLFYVVMNALESANYPTIIGGYCSFTSSMTIMVHYHVNPHRDRQVQHTYKGKTIPDAQKKIKASYWPAMKMNWKVWTPFQFININYIPVQFRVLFANLVALFWYAYLASVRK